MNPVFLEELKKRAAAMSYAYTTPQPPTPKAIPMPNMPSVENPLNLAKKTTKGLSSPSTGTDNSSKLPTAKSTQKLSFFDDGIGPLAAGAGGGLAGYLINEKFLDPLMRAKETKLEEILRTGENSLKGIRRARQIAPIASTAIGALLLAALTAKKVRERTEARMADYPGNAYQYGLNPEDMQMAPSDLGMDPRNSMRLNYY